MLILPCSLPASSAGFFYDDRIRSNFYNNFLLSSIGLLIALNYDFALNILCWLETVRFILELERLLSYVGVFGPLRFSFCSNFISSSYSFTLQLILHDRKGSSSWSLLNTFPYMYIEGLVTKSESIYFIVSKYFNLLF